MRTEVNHQFLIYEEHDFQVRDDMQPKWSEKKASEMLKNVLDEQNLTVPEFVKLLNIAGMKETRKSVYCKISRGHFL